MGIYDRILQSANLLDFHANAPYPGGGPALATVPAQ